MSKPGYGIVIKFKNGKTLRQVVAASPAIRNAVRELWLKKPEVKSVDKFTEKDYLP